MARPGKSFRAVQTRSRVMWGAGFWTGDSWMYSGFLGDRPAILINHPESEGTHGTMMHNGFEMFQVSFPRLRFLSSGHFLNTKLSMPQRYIHLVGGQLGGHREGRIAANATGFFQCPKILQSKPFQLVLCGQTVPPCRQKGFADRSDAGCCTAGTD